MADLGEFPQKLRQIVLDKLAADKLALPTMPTVALRCMELLNHEDVRMRDLVKEIERDPIASALVLRLANSAALAGTGCSTVNQALTRIGTKPLKTLFVQMATRDVFKSKDRQIAESFKQIWEHSLASGLLARDVAALVGGVDQDVAYQAGLLHDIGKPVLGIMLLELEKVQRSGVRREWLSGTAWMAVVNGVHRDVAVALARKWNLPEAVRHSVQTCGDYDISERHSIGNVVRFGNAVTKLAGVYPGEFDAAENQALVMVGRSLVGIEGEVVDRMTNGLRDRVQESLS